MGSHMFNPHHRNLELDRELHLSHKSNKENLTNDKDLALTYLLEPQLDGNQAENLLFFLFSDIGLFQAKWGSGGERRCTKFVHIFFLERVGGEPPLNIHL